MSDEKTAAEVIDNAINHMANGLERAAQALAKVAPQAWEAAVRHQRISGLLDLVSGLLLALAIVVICRMVWRVWPKWVASAKRREKETYPLLYRNVDEEDVPADTLIPVSVFGIAGLVVAILGAHLLISAGVITLLNPEYYAAKELVGLVK